MHFLSLVVATLVMVSTVSCTGVFNSRCFREAAELTYSPPVLPLEISFDAFGGLSLKAKGEVVTPIGHFGLGGGLMSDSNQSRLIVIVNNQQYVYSLDRYSDATVFSVRTTGPTDITVDVKECRTIVIVIKSHSSVASQPTSFAATPALPTPVLFTATPKGFWCPGTLPTRLYVGARGYVSSDPVNILCRVPGPCPQSDRLNAIGRGARFTVVDGPICKGGHVWWKVDPDDPRKQTAWTAEAGSRSYWISPIN